MEFYLMPMNLCSLKADKQGRVMLLKSVRMCTKSVQSKLQQTTRCRHPPQHPLRVRHSTHHPLIGGRHPTQHPLRVRHSTHHLMGGRHLPHHPLIESKTSNSPSTTHLPGCEEVGVAGLGDFTGVVQCSGLQSIQPLFLLVL